MVLGAIWSQDCFQNRRTWFVGPLWAPLADPKIDRKSFMLIHTCLFFSKKVCPKTGPQARSLFIKVLCNFGDPATLFFELSPAREHDSPKITRSLKITPKQLKVRQNGSPKLPILSPRVKKCDLLVNKMQTKKIQQKSDQKSHAGTCGLCEPGWGGPLKLINPGYSQSQHGHSNTPLRA